MPCSNPAAKGTDEALRPKAAWGGECGRWSSPTLASAAYPPIRIDEEALLRSERRLWLLRLLSGCASNGTKKWRTEVAAKKAGAA